MRTLLCFLWTLIINSLLSFLQLTTRLVFRSKRVDDHLEKELNHDEPILEVDEPAKIEGDENLDDTKSDTSTFCFRFQYQAPDDILTKNEEEVEEESKTTTNISNNRLLSEKNLSGFFEKPEAMTFRNEESFVHPEFENLEELFSAEYSLQKLNLAEIIELDVDSEEFDLVSESSMRYSLKDLNYECNGESILYDDEQELQISEQKNQNYHVNEHIGIQEESVRFNAEDSERTSEVHYSENLDEIYENEKEATEKDHRQSTNNEIESLNTETSICSSKDRVDIVEHDQNFQEVTFQNQITAEKLEKTTDFNSTENIENTNDTMLRDLDALKTKQQEICKNEKKQAEEEHISMKDLNAQENDESESLWEHQDLIEQLRTELRKVKTLGLPTILEESETETPRIPEDFKSLKIDDKFAHDGPIDELHKFYRIYLEKMRKLDILNYPKMYAIGFLQMKDPLESLGSQNIQKFASLLSQNFWLYRHRKSSSGPSDKFIKELQCDLEIVYVGQTCLSWEFLRWQYEKVQNLPATNLYRTHQYSRAAGDFRQFLVIMQRFLENESFQGPRVPNYVKSRCVLRNLLQVPVIKADSWNDKLEERKRGNDAIPSELLEDIVEECIRVFWEFIKADKDETSVILKGLISTNTAQLEHLSDYKLMIETKHILIKKEKKLKNILRTGNCMVKKFKKHREDQKNHDLLFSQIDLKLVARVLRLSRISNDQLLWCHKKLNKIKFTDRKVYREPSFLLFPF